MPSIDDAVKNKLTRDPLFFAYRSNFSTQKEKPADCEKCPFATVPYAWEDAPLYDKVSGELIPTDVLIVIPKPTLADVTEGHKTYRFPFGTANTDWAARPDGSKSWTLYKKVINRLQRQKGINVRAIYAVPCRGAGEMPAAVARYCSDQYLQRKIPLYAPKCILSLGLLAAKALGFKATKIVDIRGTIGTYTNLQGNIPIVFSYDADVYFFPSQEYTSLERFLCDFEKCCDIAKTGKTPSVDHADLRTKFQFPSIPFEIEMFLDEILETHAASPITLAFDIETTGLWHWYDKQHTAVLDERAGLTLEEKKEYLKLHKVPHPKSHIPAKVVALSFAWGREQAGAFSTLDLPKSTWKKIAEVLASPIPKVTHNGKYDMAYLMGTQGLVVNGLIGDTLLNEHLVDENRTGYMHGEYSLKKLVWDYFPEFGGYETLGNVKNALKTAGGALHLDQGDMLYYAAVDSLVTWLINRKQYFLLNHVAQNSDNQVAIPKSEMCVFSRRFLTRASRVISELEVNGLRIDLESMADMKHMATKLLAMAHSDVNSVLRNVGAESVNIASTKQLEALLYTKLGLPILKKTKGGKSSTDAATLDQLEEHDSSGLITSILIVRKLEKLVSAYLDSWHDLAKGDRVYPFVNLDGAVTGRLSISDPGIQQVPKTDKFAKLTKACGLDPDVFNLKRLFIPDDGQIMLMADFSQMEVRILASYCKKGALSELLCQGTGTDLHSLICAQVHGLEYALVESARKDKDHPQHKAMKLLRDRTKATTFTITYGGTKHTLLEKDGIPLEDGQRLFDTFFARFPEVQQYIKETHDMAKKDFFVTTMFGRRRRFPVLKYMYYNRALRQAQNSRIQSTASDVCLDAVMSLHDALKPLGGRVLTTVHDSIVAQVPKPRAIEGLRLFRKVMLEDPAKNYSWLTVPLKIDLDVGMSWGTPTSVDPIDESKWAETLGQFGI